MALLVVLSIVLILVALTRFPLPLVACFSLLIGLTTRLGGELVDPIRTTLVHDQRAMTTWVLRRS